jgi:hypothetical protein
MIGLPQPSLRSFLCMSNRNSSMRSNYFDDFLRVNALSQLFRFPFCSERAFHYELALACVVLLRRRFCRKRRPSLRLRSDGTAIPKSLCKASWQGAFFFNGQCSLGIRQHGRCISSRHTRRIVSVARNKPHCCVRLGFIAQEPRLCAAVRQVSWRQYAGFCMKSPVFGNGKSAYGQ